MKIKRKYTIEYIGVNLCRFILSGLFIFSGFVKAVDPLGSQYKIQSYLEAFGIVSWFPSYVSLIASIALSSLEFVIGVFLFFGIKRKQTTGAILLFLLVMTPLTFYLVLTNPISDCGCFGDALVLTNWQTFGKNVVLLAFAVIVYRKSKEIVRFVSRKSQGWITIYTPPFIVLFSLYCLRYLPIIDFRPYKIGTDIQESMSIPPDAKRNVYESYFILEKDGERKEFTIENYPDSTWTFVDTRNVLKQKGYEPPIVDFSIIDLQSGESITDRILEDKNYTFLLIAHSIDEADDANIDLINEIYDYSVENGYGFYCLTSSSQEDIEAWEDKTGAEYAFCLTDKIILKTMIRSNPGLMLIKEGRILNKWSGENLPNEYLLTDRLENIKTGEIKQGNKSKSISVIILWFVLPLLIISGIDDLFVRRRFGRKLVKTIERLPQNLMNPLIHSKMRKNIVAGNWKMNKTLQEGVSFAKELNEVLSKQKLNCDVVICTPFIHLASVAPVVKGIGLGAQNCADKTEGAYTGEVSAQMVASTGAKYVILGHSERRAYYGETPEILKEKVQLALAAGLTPIFCIGEVLEEREANKQNEVVSAQLSGSLFGLSVEDFSKIVIAYEPVWAIGTGKTATAAQAQEIHAYIRSVIADKYGKGIADSTSILYGGSCKPSNAKELFDNSDVDGGLIGGAALNTADFKGIIDAFS
ncbi:Triosephosphate isomerase [termite gut metagenome]|uniref:triose-phosphate isomerase n=1 Tax=termite gut metagenome TaxID=433724 RepID=A0A5J4SJ21_9ZZZZ